MRKTIIYAWLQLLVFFILGNILQQVAASANSINNASCRLRGTRETPTCSITTARRQASSQKPNIVWIMADDLRATELPGYAEDPLNFPNFQNLFARSTAFLTDTVYPVCGPSRAAMLTGMDIENTLTFDNPVFTAYNTTILKPMSDLGYYTGMFGKVNHDFPEDQIGMQLFYYMNQTDVKLAPTNTNGDDNCGGELLGCTLPMKQLTDPIITQNALGFLKDAYDLIKKGAISNFFVMIGYRRPHVEMSAPETVAEFQDLPLPDITEPTIETNGLYPFAHKRCDELIGYYVGNTPLIGPGTPTIDQVCSNTKLAKKIRGLYWDAVHATDQQIGKLLAALNKYGFTQNTIVIVTADHGYGLCEKNLLCKGDLYYEETRIPGYISVPGVQGGVLAETLASNIDFFPTVLELATNATYVENFRQSNGKALRGQSLVPALSNPKLMINQFTYSRYGRGQPATEEQTNPMTSDTVPGSCDRPPFTTMLHSITTKNATHECRFTSPRPFTEVDKYCGMPKWPGQPSQLYAYGITSKQMNFTPSVTDFDAPIIQPELYCHPADQLYITENGYNETENLAINPSKYNAALITQLSQQIKLRYTMN